MPICPTSLVWLNLIVKEQSYMSKLCKAFQTAFLVLVNFNYFCIKYKQQSPCHGAKLIQTLFDPAFADDWLEVLRGIIQDRFILIST